MNTKTIVNARLAGIAQAVQPLVFETGIDDPPYTTNGTLFLVRWCDVIYAVTARHALRPESPPAICIFPNDHSRRIFNPGSVFFVPSAYEPEDFVDLAVIDIGPEYIDDLELKTACPLELAIVYFDDWESRLDDHDLFLLGYPEERSHIDWEGEFIRTDRVVLEGSLIEPSQLEHLYQLAIRDKSELQSFSGMSGGPIVAISRDPGNAGAILCGMAVRGTPMSGVVHFVPSQVLVHAIKLKHALDGQAVGRIEPKT